jgi:ribosome-associated protein
MIPATLKKRIDQITGAAAEKKAEDISVLDVSEFSSLADAVIFCSGKNDPQLNAITSAILKQAKGRALQTGTGESGWIVLDYGDVIVHVMTTTLREHYRLESIWGKDAVTYYV